MRMLFTCRPLTGHFDPLLPLAKAAQVLGHDVAFATGEPFTSRARDDGFESFRAGPDEGFRATWTPRFPGYTELVGSEQRRFFFTEIFANLELVPRADDLGPIVDAWRPDVLVHEMAELAAPLVAAARGITCVDVGYGALIDRWLVHAAADAAAPHWRARGLEPDAVAGLFRHLYVDPCPPSLQNPEIAAIPSVQVRPAAAARSDGAVPDWLDRLEAGSIVYLTMGTVWNTDLDLFRSVIDAVRDEDIALVVTVGRQNDPDALGPQPPNVVVHRFVPQNLLLPRCDAVVTHGGAGTMLGVLAHGVPLVLLPQGADQYANAERAVAAGAGRQLLAQERSVDAIREAILTVLDDRDIRGAAQRIASEIDAMPEPRDVVPAIERL